LHVRRIETLAHRGQNFPPPRQRLTQISDCERSARARTGRTDEHPL